jgi:hypothetical protein
MKKLLDRIWEWMKSTAWFQVVLIVGVVVAVVLSISPITKGITSAISAQENDVNYYINNRINYDTLTTKIDGLEADGEEFAVIFGDTTGSALTASGMEKGINTYESTTGAVKIYLFNTAVNKDNKSNYDADSAWYVYYEVTKEMVSGIRTAAYNAYNDVWQNYTQSNTLTEVSQSGSFDDVSTTVSSYLKDYTLIWFRKSANIDQSVKDVTANSLNEVTGHVYDYHVAKVYLTIPDGSASEATVNSGLRKFFGTSKLGS